VGIHRVGEKNNSFFGKNALQIAIFYFIVRPPYPLPKTYDGWVRRERYSGSDLGEKSFQLFSLLIVYIYRLPEHRLRPGCQLGELHGPHDW
jgi:hypothetical protein